VCGFPLFLASPTESIPISDLVAQDHRFDLVKNFGCSASTHPSTAASLIAWGPPLVICGISFFLIGKSTSLVSDHKTNCFVTGFAISNFFQMPSERFSTHLSSRSPMTTSLFIRQLATSLLMVGVAILITLFSFFSVPVFRPWVSWASVHSQFSVIDLVRNSDEIRGFKLQWWGLFVLSVVYILLSFTLGEEARDAFKWARSLIQKRPLRRPFILANQ
jgi:pheromone a factor receptor